MAEPRRILVIDDEPDHAEIVATLLGRRGYEVAVARDGDEGLARAWDLGPHVILLDLYMPAVDGFSAATHLRADEKTKHVPIIVLSASLEHCVGRIAEPVAYLAKPFRVAELIWAVEVALARGPGARAAR